MTNPHDNCSEVITSHENLVKATCAYIALVGKSNKFLDPQEGSQNVHGLLTCLENVFYNAPKSSFKLQKDRRVWHWVSKSCEKLPNNCIELVNSLENLQSGLAKLRALLRLALQSKNLHCYLDVLFNSKEAIRDVYRPSTVLLSNKLQRIINAAGELQYIDFCFDMRAEELNFPRIGQIDYALLISIPNGFEYQNLTDFGELHLKMKCCKTCRDYASKAISTESQKKYLEDVVNSSNDQLMDYRDELVRLSHDNRRLRSAFDQLQTKVALMHEEYILHLRLLGCNQTASIRLDSSWQGLSRPTCRRRLSVDWSAFEAKEGLGNFVTPIKSPTFSSPSFFQSSRGGRGLSSPPLQCLEGSSGNHIPTEVDFSVIEATEDLDVIDLLYERDIANGNSAQTSPFLRVECPRSRTFQFAVGEQEASQCPEIYRLPSATDDIPPFDLSQLSVTVRPGNTNYRSRFSVPKTTGGGSLRRAAPQLDLLSELQQTDSSFPLTGLSSLASGEDDKTGGVEDTEGACSTSDQVSDIVNEVALEDANVFSDYARPDYDGSGNWGCPTTTSSSRNTVLTSTSTIRPTNSCNSLASPSSIQEDLEAKNPPTGTFRRSTSDLLTTTMVATGIVDCWARRVASPPSHPDK